MSTPTSTPTNARRAAWALLALNRFAEITGLEPFQDDPQTALTDFLADMRHLCSALDVDFYACDTRAYQHYIEDLSDAKLEGEAAPTRSAVIATAEQIEAGDPLYFLRVTSDEYGSDDLGPFNALEAQQVQERLANAGDGVARSFQLIPSQ